MRILFLLPLLLLFLFSVPLAETVQAQELTTFILVRHAEKVDDGTKDPALSENGKDRAQRLNEHLKNSELTAVYSTPYRRTQNTVEAIAKTHGLQVLDYDPFSEGVPERMLAKHRGGTILIAGHSNTTPNFANTLIGKDQLEQLDESDYDNIFIVMISEIGEGRVLRLTY